jgi:hypothetical protein
MAIRRRPVPDFAVTVVTPAFDGACDRERAGQGLPDGDRPDTAGETGDRDRYVSVRARPVPKFAVAV